MNTFFQPNELDDFLRDLQKSLQSTYSQFKDPYELFIFQCKKKQYPPNTIIETHHIIPKHAGGTDEASNLIKLSLKDHITAHWLRWQVFGDENDKRAYLFRVSTPEERRRMNIEKTKALQVQWKAEGKYRFDPEKQRALGLKGGAKGGLANTEAQFKARSKVGQQFGPITGKANQGLELVEFLKKYSIWEFKGCVEGNTFKSKEGGLFCPSNMEETEFYVLIGPKETFKSVVDALSLFAPGSINMKNYSTMNKLIRKNKRIFGWQLFNTLTRSEVEEGALENLKITFYTEDMIPE